MSNVNVINRGFNVKLPLSVTVYIIIIYSRTRSTLLYYNNNMIPH